MPFHTSIHDRILFFQWKVNIDDENATAKFVASCLAVFFLAITQEFLQALRNGNEAPKIRTPRKGVAGKPRIEMTLTGSSSVQTMASVATADSAPGDASSKDDPSAASTPERNPEPEKGSTTAPPREEPEKTESSSGNQSCPTGKEDQRTTCRSQTQGQPPPPDRNREPPTQLPKKFTRLRPTWANFGISKTLFKTVVYSIHLIVSFLCMLIAMTFNVWLLLSLLFGFGLGYFIFHLDNPICPHDCIFKK